MNTYSGSETPSDSLPTLVNVTDHEIFQSVTYVNGSLGNWTAGQGYVPSDADMIRIVVIAVLLALTIIGNMILILVLLCKRSRRIKRVNILLVNLAFGDLTVALFVNSTEILFLAFGDWALGAELCKVSVYVQMVCLSSATNLLTAMSIDRYQVIVKPMQSLARRPRIWLKIVIAWILSLIFAIPQLFIFVQYNKGFKHDKTPIRICGSKGYTAPWQRKVNFTFTTIYILVVPMVIMLYCYAKIIQVVWIRAKPETRRCPLKSTSNSNLKSSTLRNSSSDAGRDVCLPNERSGFSCACDVGGDVEISSKARKSVGWVRTVKECEDSNSRTSVKKAMVRVQDLNEDDLNSGSPRMSVRRNLVTASKRRVLIMTLTVVVSFLVCQTPYIMVTLVRIYSDYKLQLETLVFITEVLVMVHSTLNPILYGLFTLRHYHLKHIFSLVSSSARPAVPQEHLQRQQSHESNKLLTNARTKLNSRGSTSSTTTFIANNKHANPLLSHKNPENIKKPTFKDTSAASSANVPNSAKSRSKSQPYFTRFRKCKSVTSDVILFANMEAIHRANEDEAKTRTTNQPDSELNSFTQCTLIANSPIIHSGGSVSTQISNITPFC